MSHPKVTQKRFKTVLQKFLVDSGLTKVDASIFLGFTSTWMGKTLHVKKKTLRPETVVKINAGLEVFYSVLYVSPVTPTYVKAGDTSPVSMPIVIKKPSFYDVFKAFLISIFSTIKGNK